MITFEKLLDKYRSELCNLYSLKDGKHYWLQKSNETRDRLIEMYNEREEK